MATSHQLITATLLLLIMATLLLLITATLLLLITAMLLLLITATPVVTPATVIMVATEVTPMEVTHTAAILIAVSVDMVAVTIDLDWKINTNNFIKTDQNFTFK